MQELGLALIAGPPTAGWLSWVVGATPSTPRRWISGIALVALMTGVALERSRITFVDSRLEALAVWIGWSLACFLGFWPLLLKNRVVRYLSFAPIGLVMLGATLAGAILLLDPASEQRSQGQLGTSYWFRQNFSGGALQRTNGYNLTVYRRMKIAPLLGTKIKFTRMTLLHAPLPTPPRVTIESELTHPTVIVLDGDREIQRVLLD